jgi:hypothetical protein
MPERSVDSLVAGRANARAEPEPLPVVEPKDPSMPAARALAARLLAALAFAPNALAQPPAAPPPVPETPPMPEAVQSGETLEPEVRIIRREREVITEYRQEGRLYMVKITPVVGPVYWLVDGDGDGSLETRYAELAPGILIPAWVLFSW